MSSNSSPEQTADAPADFARGHHRTLEYAKLAAQSQDLRGERCAREEARTEKNEDNMHEAHGYASVWLLRSTTVADQPGETQSRKFL